MGACCEEEVGSRKKSSVRRSQEVTLAHILW